MPISNKKEDRVVPCKNLFVIRPTNTEVDLLSVETIRLMLSNNRVIEVACK